MQGQIWRVCVGLDTGQQRVFIIRPRIQIQDWDAFKSEEIFVPPE